MWAGLGVRPSKITSSLLEVRSASEIHLLLVEYKRMSRKPHFLEFQTLFVYATKVRHPTSLTSGGPSETLEQVKLLSSTLGLGRQRYPPLEACDQPANVK